MMRKIVYTVSIGASLAALAACSSSEVLVAHSVDLQPADTFIVEEALLDIGVSVFDSGVPDGEIDTKLREELVEQGTFVQIRRAEALYFAVQLRDTLRSSNYWGSVWVTPEVTSSADVNVVAKIIQSDGEVASVDVNATDAAGRVWIDDTYTVVVAAGAYNRQRYGGLDPYQDLFNEIANDLAAARMALSDEDAARVREIAALRYAGELSPEAFADYVSEDDGEFVLNRLPAEDDPQFNRTQRARQREHLFFETLNQHYVNFAREATSSYDSWREYSREETIQVREITRSARFRTGMGIASIVASFVYGNNADSSSFSDRVIRDTLMYIGMDMLRNSATRRQEKRLHVEALEELSASFDDEVEPLVVNVQGTEHRLTGTAEVQYQEWRDLLRELYMEETGFAPEDMDMYVEPELPDDAPAQEPAEESAESMEVNSDVSGGAQPEV
jgi:hypothetical protein